MQIPELSASILGPQFQIILQVHTEAESGVASCGIQIAHESEPVPSAEILGSEPSQGMEEKTSRRLIVGASLNYMCEAH